MTTPIRNPPQNAPIAVDQSRASTSQDEHEEEDDQQHQGEFI